MPGRGDIKGWYSLEPKPDGKTSFAILGWAVSPQGPPMVHVLIDGREQWAGLPVIHFPGVQEKYPQIPGSDSAGFWVPVEPARYATGRHTIEVLGEGPAGARASFGFSEFTVLPPTSHWMAIPLLAIVLILGPGLLGWGLSRRFEHPSTFGRSALWILAGGILLLAWIVHSGTAFDWILAKRPGPGACLSNWDGQWYLKIAREGYGGGSNPSAVYAYFPLYPLLLRTLNQLPITVDWTGAVANLGLALAAFVLLSKRYPEGARGVILLFSLPFSFFHVVLYTESLFLFLAALYAWALDRRRSWLLFIVGVLAGWTRVNAILLVLLCADAAFRRNWRIAAAACLGPLAGLASWCLYLGLTTGDPLKFLHAQGAFGRFTSFHPGRLWDYWCASFSNPTGMALWEVGALELTLVLAASLLFRKRWGEGLYSAAVVLYPLATLRLISLNRYALAAFPAWIHSGNLVRRRWIFWSLWAVSLVLLGFFSHRFARQFFVG